MDARYTVSQETVRLSALRPVVAQRKGPAQGDLQAHDHAFYELSFVCSGTAVQETADGLRELSRGDFMLFSPGQPHNIRNRKDFCFYNVYYLYEWMLHDRALLQEIPRLFMLFCGQSLFPSRVARAPIQIHLDSACADQTEREFADLADCELTGNAYRIFVQATLMKCFAIWSPALLEQVTLDDRFLENKLIQYTVGCIDTALAEGRPCNVAAWAVGAGYSADYFTRSFRNLTGETPVGCFQRRRMQYVAHALIYSAENITEIALRLGFSDAAHLSRSFRKNYGMTPNDYRHRLRTDGDPC